MRDRPVISAEFIASHKRRRVIRAFAELMTEQTYEKTKVTAIVARAAVARKTLYENFEGKEEVFLAAFDLGSEGMLGRVREACDGADDPRARVEAGLDAFLDYVAEEPALSHLCLVEALSATPETVRRHETVLAGFVEIARDVLPEDERLPETTAETLVGGVSWTVYRLLRHGRAADAPGLKDELVEFMLAPYSDELQRAAASGE